MPKQGRGTGTKKFIRFQEFQKDCNSLTLRGVSPICHSMRSERDTTASPTNLQLQRAKKFPCRKRGHFLQKMKRDRKENRDKIVIKRTKKRNEFNRKGKELDFKKVYNIELISKTIKKMNRDLHQLIESFWIGIW